ncbi:MAG: DUF1697 domain-containing protein [Chloroflexi bacterium]|nr:DUF1697 domain-containing protein [Chloroflexota bacterium]
MQRYIAFLRALNVGGHTVTMETLRTVFQGMGFTEVSTFIASGNVIFRTPAADVRSLERRIETALKDALGYEVATFLRREDELAEIAAYEPFQGVNARPGDRLHILFLPAAPDAGVRGRVEALSNDADLFHVRGAEVYWLRRGNLMDATVKDVEITRALGKVPTTMRNLNTVRRIAAKLGGPVH